MSDSLENLRKLTQDIKAPFDIPVKPLSSMLDVNIAHYKPRKEDTFAYQMQLQTNQIIEKSEEQINLLNKQNEHLNNNVKKLEELLKIKENELEEAKNEALESKKYNKKMMIITVISTIVAIISMIAGIAIPIITGGTA